MSEVRLVIKSDKFEYLEDRTNVLEDVWEYCAIAAFFENERKAGRDTNVAMISCYCSRCSPRML